MQDLAGKSSNKIGGFSRFRQNRIARSQGRRDLAQGDGKGEIPRGNTSKHTARDVCALCRNMMSGLSRIVAQEIHGFAQLRDGIIEGLARLARQQGDGLCHISLKPVGYPLKRLCAHVHRRLPDLRGPIGRCHVTEGRPAHFAHDILGDCGVSNTLCGSLLSFCAGGRQQRAGRPPHCFKSCTRLRNPLQCAGILKIPARSVSPLGREKFGRPRNSRVRARLL